jgi:hypothetical protein
MKNHARLDFGGVIRWQRRIATPPDLIDAKFGRRETLQSFKTMGQPSA